MRETDTYILNIDTPIQKKLASRQIELQGWLIVKEKTKISKLRIRQGATTVPVQFGVRRHDVAIAFPDISPALTEYSGFEQDFECSVEEVYLELDLGGGYEIIHRFEFEISSPYRQYNPYLAINWMDHKNLMETKSYYNHEPLAYTRPGKQTDNKVIAFYLPQYHPIKENDITWGKGFTEWTNVASGQPRFIGHNQPLLPSDLGYYDLRISENIKAQIDMAKNHGIYGFCMYYYWFSGKKILDMPINTVIEHKEWDFRFMICWANENWTKRWDGREKDVILEQKYRKSDPIEFIKDVEHILLDPCYIRVNGKPVLAVYRCEHLDNAKRYAKVWRDYFREKHQLELELVSVMSFEGDDPETYGFNAGLDFSPSKILRSRDEALKVTVPTNKRLIDPFFEGTVFDYRSAVRALISERETVSARVYPCVMPSWDNDARKKGNGSYVFYNESPGLYKKWLQHAFTQTNKETPFVFVNAWNEWAEGTVLEPTRHYGYAYLNKTREAIEGTTTIKQKTSRNVAILYIDTIEHFDDIKKAIRTLRDADFSIRIAVCSQDLSLEEGLRSYSSDVEVLSVPERGGDVLPFIEMIKKIDYSTCAAVIKLAFVHNRDVPLDLIKSKRILHRNLEKSIDENAIIFSGVLPNRRKTKDKISQALSFITSSNHASTIINLNLLPEDFTVKSESEYETGVVDEIPEGFLAIIQDGFFANNITNSYKKISLREDSTFDGEKN